MDIPLPKFNKGETVVIQGTIIDPNDKYSNFFCNTTFKIKSCEWNYNKNEWQYDYYNNVSNDMLFEKKLYKLYC